MNTVTIAGPGLSSGSAAALTPATGGGGGGGAGVSVRASIEDPIVPITALQLASILSGPPTSSGQPVTAERAMRIATFWACVWIVSSSIARMGIITYRRTPGGRERARDHANYELLALRPNPDMTAFAFWQAAEANRLVWGGAFAEIVRRGNGRTDRLVLIESGRVRPFRADGELRYEVRLPEGGKVTLLKRDILHLPGMTFNGIDGLSVIGYARETLGMGLAQDQFAGSLTRNQLRPSGTLEHPGVLGTTATANLRASLEQLYAGALNAGKPLILEEGMKWSSAATMPLVDAEFMAGRTFTVEEICRFFNVPPHKVQHLLRSTNNNIEQQSLDFLADGLGPRIEGTKQELNWKLFTEAERQTLYCEHNTASVIQMDAAARGTLYQKLIDIGAMSPDDVCERENLNALPDGRGTTHMTAGNRIPMPTPEQANTFAEAWAKKGGASSGGPGGSDQSGSAAPPVAGGA